MNACAFSYETLSSYVDGELKLEVERSLRRHLDVCQSCRAKVDALLALKEIVAGNTDVRPVPHTLREWLSGIKPDRSLANRLPVAIIGAAACVLLAVATSLWWFSNRSSHDAITSTLVADHIHFMQVEKPLEVTSADPAFITRWFSGKVSFPVKPPRFRRARLLGARLCSLWGHKIALTFYEALDKRLSVFVMSKDALPGGGGARAECHAALGGYEVCFHPIGDTLLAVVAKEEQMKLLLPELKSIPSSG